MKLSLLLILITFLIVVDSSAQSQITAVNNEELSSATIEKNIIIPCQYFVNSYKRENGKSFFTTKDSCHLEFDFFTANKLSFFDSNQTSDETITSYINWLSKNKHALKDVKYSKVDENTKDDYIIYNIKDALEEYYQLLAIENNVLISIKIVDHKMAIDNQLERLKVLYEFNKD